MYTNTETYVATMLVHFEALSIFVGEINRGPPGKPHQTSVKWEMRE